LDFTVVQNIDTTGKTQLGNFVVTVDDGTGYPPPALIATVYSAVDAVRPIGSIFSVQPPSVIQANVSLMISVAASAQKSQLLSPVAAALTSFINALPIGQVLPITRIAQIAYDASTSIINVTFPQINGEVADLVPGAAGVIKSGTISVS
jgi:phage-related baseplate assembly protein